MAASRVVVTFMMVALVAVSDLAESKVANCQRWYQDTCNLVRVLNIWHCYNCFQYR